MDAELTELLRRVLQIATPGERPAIVDWVADLVAAAVKELEEVS